MAYIKLSRIKLSIILFCTLAFTYIGIWKLTGLDFRPATILLAVIIIPCGVFFGLLSLFFAMKLFDPRPGILFKKDGFVDNSAGVAAGEVLWRDVTGIEVTGSKGGGSILVLVKNPEEYIDRQKWMLKRKLMTWNAGITGTPITISVGMLDISFDDLAREMGERFDAFHAG